MDESLKTWFVREILVHEEALVRYLRRIWRTPDEVYDLRQETYIRVYQAAATQRPASPKAFLFATARHLIADRIRRQRVITIDTMGDLEALNVLIDEISPEQRVGARQELRHLAVAFDQLPEQCRKTVWMRRVEELSQKEVAHRLGISPRTVEKHLMKGIRLLANALFGGDTDMNLRRNADPEHESRHGKQRTD